MPTQNRQLAAIIIAEADGVPESYGESFGESFGERFGERFGEAVEDIFKPYLKQYNGRLLESTGARLVLRFTSAVAAVNYALDVQRTLPVHQSDWTREQRLRFRLGINLGDIIVEGDDVHGEGVDVAAALGALADPGGITIAGNVLEQVRRRLDHVAFEALGPQQLGGRPEPVPSYRVLLDPSAIEAEAKRGKTFTGRRIALALLVLVLFAGAALWQLRA